MLDNPLQGPHCLTPFVYSVLSRLGAYLGQYPDGATLPSSHDLREVAQIGADLDSLEVSSYRGLLPHIDSWAALGMTQGQIADRLGLARSILRDALIFLPDLRIAISGGLARGIDLASATIARNSKSGDSAAAIFFLKARGV